MIRSLILCTCVLFAASGCAGTSRHMLGPAHAPVAVETVKLYHARPPGAVDIAYLESTSAMGFGTQGQLDAASARIAREAAKLGANGVLVLGRGRTDSPVGLGVGVGAGHYDHNSAGGVSVGGGIPTTQEHARGVAIHVPAEAIPRD